jgi:hypothetical protein
MPRDPNVAGHFTAGRHAQYESFGWDGGVGVTKQCVPLTSPPAANSVLLPKAKPRAMRQHFVMSSIGSREVASAERSGVRLCEDALKALDFGNSLLGVHSVSISNMAVAIVKRNGTCMSCLLPRQFTSGTSHAS